MNIPIFLSIAGVTESNTYRFMPSIRHLHNTFKVTINNINNLRLFTTYRAREVQPRQKTYVDARQLWKTCYGTRTNLSAIRVQTMRIVAQPRKFKIRWSPEIKALESFFSINIAEEVDKMILEDIQNEVKAKREKKEKEEE